MPIPRHRPVECTGRDVWFLNLPAPVLSLPKGAPGKLGATIAGSAKTRRWNAPGGRSAQASALHGKGVTRPQV